MSYFPTDIPFMSDEEMRENGIRIPGDVSDTNVGNIEYIRKQDAVDELRCEPIFSDAWNALREARDRIKAIKPADVVEVVRCRDCGSYIDLRCWCKVNETKMMKNDFCSYGRRER